MIPDVVGARGGARRDRNAGSTAHVRCATIARVDKGMRRFWITFDLPPVPTPPRKGVSLDGDLWAFLRHGVGVTAEDEDAALALVERELGSRSGRLPPIHEIQPDFDVS